MLFRILLLDALVEALTGEVVELPAAGLPQHSHDHDHGQFDPHVWLDPVNAGKMAENIKDALVQADEGNREYYEANYREFTDKLKALDKRYREELINFNRREIVVSHAAFGYLTKRYGLEQIAVKGITSQEEPGAAKMAEITKLLREKQIKYVFFETLTSPKLSEVLAREVGADTAVLNPIGGLTQEEIRSGMDYISVMEENLAALKMALGD